MSAPSDSSTQRRPTFRSLTSSFSSISDDEGQHTDTRERVVQMVHRANEGIPLNDDEIEGICNGIQNLVPQDAPIDFEELKELLKNVAHLSHKNWGVTSANSDKLSRSLSISSDDESVSSSPLSSHAQQLLERILKDGNWKGAVEKATPIGSGDGKPWAVLVTGVNGIRKTTSMYQPWFGELLAEAICPPMDAPDTEIPTNLPTGKWLNPGSMAYF